MIPVRNLNEQPPFQASKWLQIHVLLDPEELKTLFDELESFFLVKISGVSRRGEGLIKIDDFIHVYSEYIKGLKEGKMDESPLLASAMTTSLDDLFAACVADDKQLIRIRRPIIQLQEHAFDYSPFDHKFRSMVLGTDCITWGLQFSFPQLFQDPKNNEIINTLTLPNGALFRSLQKWMRRHTIPTPFEVEGQIIKTPIKLGKKCLDWIHYHPQLKQKKIKIAK